MYLYVMWQNRTILTSVTDLLLGATLQNRNRGIKATLANARPRIMMEPIWLAFGHWITLANILPTKSPILNSKKQPTGMKYLLFHSLPSFPEPILTTWAVIDGKTAKQTKNVKKTAKIHTQILPMMARVVVCSYEK